jgi:hypothetical protein
MVLLDIARHHHAFHRLGCSVSLRRCCYTARLHIFWHMRRGSVGFSDPFASPSRVPILQRIYTNHTTCWLIAHVGVPHSNVRDSRVLRGLEHTLKKEQGNLSDPASQNQACFASLYYNFTGA